MLETLEQVGGGEDPEAGGRQFDRQWQPVEASRDLGDGRDVVVAEREVGPHSASAVDEQLHGRRGCDGVDAEMLVAVGKVEG